MGHLDRPYDSWPASICAIPADAMHLPAHGRLTVGGPADFVLFRARRYSELLSRPQYNRCAHPTRPMSSPPHTADAVTLQFTFSDTFFAPGNRAKQSVGQLNTTARHHFSNRFYGVCRFNCPLVLDANQASDPLISCRVVVRMSLGLLRKPYGNCPLYFVNAA